jgi:hypothetical protein
MQECTKVRVWVHSQLRKEVSELRVQPFAMARLQP